MTQRDYELIARTIKWVPISKAAKSRLVEAFCRELAIDSHRFEPVKFRIMCKEG